MRGNFCPSMVKRKQLTCFLILALIHMVFVAYIYLRSPYIRKQGFVRLLQHSLFQHKPPNCNINFTQSVWSKVNVTWETLENKMSFNLHPGGRYNPEGCHLFDDIVVLIPYRNREDQLKTFIYYMHPFLQSKKISYRIVVVEMAPGAKFNRAMLFNIGFMEMNKVSDHQCYIFHDVDLLPEKTSTPYNCDKSPRHMAVAIDKNNYKLPYESYFGGICSLTKEHFQRINGFSNQYFGWGGEDDDFHDRLKRAKLNISRLSLEEGRFHMLLHPTEEPNPEKLELFKSMKARSSFDGLNSLKYEVLKYELKPLYTWILVNINETNVKTFDREQLIKINEALAKNNRTIHRKPHIRHTKLVRNSSVV